MQLGQTTLLTSRLGDGLVFAVLELVLDGAQIHGLFDDLWVIEQTESLPVDGDTKGFCERREYGG